LEFQLHSENGINFQICSFDRKLKKFVCRTLSMEHSLVIIIAFMKKIKENGGKINLFGDNCSKNLDTL
jgi:hypothetical protein